MLMPAPVAAAQIASECPAGVAPRFVFGFADLKAQIGEPMGEPVTCEFSDPNGTGDVHQRTTTGLAFWRKSSNTPTFTNGFEHWARTPNGWVTWTGAGIDPPGLAAMLYPELVISAFMGACTRSDPNSPALQTYCTCSLDKLAARYSLADFIMLEQRVTSGAQDPELNAVFVECALETLG